MTANDVLTTIATHMVEGLMIHEQMTNGFLYLGLDGFAKRQKKQYLEETKNYLKLCRFKIKHFGTAILPRRVSPPDLIPEEWQNTDKESITEKQKKGCVSFFFNEWVTWERQTKQLYSDAVKDLLSLSEVDTSKYIEDLVVEVGNELSEAIDERNRWASCDYDLVSMYEEQDKY